MTRDRHYGRSTWNGIDFSVIDTGGYVTGSDDVFEEEINKQVLLAIDEADVLVFLVDVISGVTDLDESVANMLRRTDKSVVLAVNKVDNNERRMDAAEFYSLGLGEFFSISSTNGSGTGDLLDEIVKLLPERDHDPEEDIPKYTIVGRPNVGKSTLINTLMGEERNIVTPVAGTTRDSIYTLYNKYQHKFYLVDTAGLRKKAKVNEDLEFYSTLRSVRSIENSDVCLLLIDATRGIESQDLNIMHLILKNSKGLVVIVNKWDLVEKETNTIVKLEKEIKDKTAPFTDYPILFISAINKQRIHKVLDTAIEVYNNRTKKIPTSQLNEVMLNAIELNPPPSVKGKYIKIKYVTQLPTHSPSFAFFCNLPQYLKEPYKRYLENRLRENFDFSGAPVKIFFRKK